MRPRFAAVLLALAATSLALFAAPLEQWTLRSPLPQGNPLFNVNTVNGIWVSVGEFGTILTSTNGTTWTSRPSGVSVDLRDCIYGAGIYVVVGDFGTVLTSPDGMSWTQRNSGTFYSLKAVTFADNQFVAVGENGSILTSPDALDWTPRSSAAWTLFDIVKAGGLYIAVGGTAQQGVILTSLDARIWSLRLFVPGGSFSTVAFGGGKFAAAAGGDSFYSGTIWTSANGTNWQATSSLGFLGLTSVYYEDGQWFASSGDFEYDFGPGELFTGSDLVHWSLVTNTAAISGMASTNGRIVACLVDGTFLTSTNKVNWVGTSPAMLPIYPRDLEYLNGSFVDAGYNQIALSTDGSHWTNLITLTNTGNFLSITYGEGRYVAGGEYRTIWTSLDGVNWTNPAPDLGNPPYVADVAVAYGNGVFVGASGFDGDILTSADGLSWMLQQPGTNSPHGYTYFSDVKFGGGRFIAVGGPAIATSTDGTNWFFQGTNQYMAAVACGNGTYVAVGYDGVITSHDGTNWVSELLDPLNDVAYGDGYFVAVGTGTHDSGFSTESPIWVSPDGVNWTQRHSNTPLSLDHVTFGNGTFLIAGENNVILQSVLQVEPFVVGVSINSSACISISGPVPGSYRIDYAENVGGPLQWKTLTTLPAAQSPVKFNDPSWTNSAARLYRAVLLP